MVVAVYLDCFLCGLDCIILHLPMFLMTECECSELVSGSGTCLDSGTLSIRNGMVTYGSVSIGSKATYQCVDGFSLSGVSTRTCLVDGSWSDSLPTCQGNFCTIVPKQSNDEP